MTDAPGQIDRVAGELRRMQERATRPLWQRLRDAEIAGAMRSTVSAMDYSEARVSHGKLEDVIPPSAHRDTGTATWAALLTPIKHGIESLERALDLDMGHCTSRNYAAMTKDEKDKAILEDWRGVHSSEVARTAPELGSPRTVERVRSLNGQRPVDGTQQQKAA